MTVFAGNVELINNHNKEAAEGKHTFTLEVNKYADLTNAEFRQRNTLKVHAHEMVESLGRFPIVGTIPDDNRPDSIDWTDDVSYVIELPYYTVDKNVLIIILMV